MWKRISRILQVNEEHAHIEQEKEERGDASQIFQLAIVQIEQAIHKNSVIWENVRKNKEELYQKIEQIKYAIQQEEASLQYALRSKNKSLSSSHILQKENLEKQKREFETLYNTVLQTWQQMQLQKQKLTLQLQELKTKEILLTNKLQNAKNQRELQLVLDDLEISDEIDLFEDKVNQAQIEVDLVDGVLDIENQIDGLEANSLQDIDEKINKKFENYQQQEQDKVQEKQRKRIEQLFSRNENKTQQQKANEKKQLEEKRKNLLEQFKTNHKKNVNTNDNKKLEDEVKAHFEKENKTTENKSDVLNNFFSQSDKLEEKTEYKSTNTGKKSVINDFFGNNKDEKKKEIPTEEPKKSEEQLSKEEQMKKFFGK
jgi:hypothetical protein